MISDCKTPNLYHYSGGSHILPNSFPADYNLLLETGEYGKDNKDIYSVLNELRKDNVHRVISSHISINSIRYKIHMLSDIVGKMYCMKFLVGLPDS